MLCHNLQAYVIELVVSDCSWTIQRRYSEFHDLHEKLVALRKVDQALLPPKKLLWNQSKSFVEKRRQDLENYLQELLNESSYLPTPLLHFLEFDIYVSWKKFAQKICSRPGYRRMYLLFPKNMGI